MTLTKTKKIWQVFGLAILLAPILSYNIPYFLRPERTNTARSLFQGIAYQREFRSAPRPAMIHIVTVDLTAPGVGIFVTPGEPTSDLTETNARTVSEFLQEFKLQLAVNANFFYPCILMLKIAPQLSKMVLVLKGRFMGLREIPYS
jgi:hypothetical protein